MIFFSVTAILLLKIFPTNQLTVFIPIYRTFLHRGGGIISLKALKIHSEIKDMSNGIDYAIFDEFVRVLKKINIFIWCSKSQIKDILNYFDNCNFELLVWCKTNTLPKTNNCWLADVEYCLYIREKGVPLNDGYELKSKYYISPTEQGSKKLFQHPTIKPLALVKRHLLHATKPNDIILDPFCGSGTTCVAAKLANRQFVGMEINEEYYKIAKQRINNECADHQLSFLLK